MLLVDILIVVLLVTFLNINSLTLCWGGGDDLLHGLFVVIELKNQGGGRYV